jgi:hypothetical protein
MEQEYCCESHLSGGRSACGKCLSPPRAPLLSWKWPASHKLHVHLRELHHNPRCQRNEGTATADYVVFQSQV